MYECVEAFIYPSLFEQQRQSKKMWENVFWLSYKFMIFTTGNEWERKREYKAKWNLSDYLLTE